MISPASGPFAAVYTVLAVVAVGFGLMTRGRIGQDIPVPDWRGLDAVAIALLADGRRRALDAVHLELLAAGALSVDPVMGQLCAVAPPMPLPPRLSAAREALVRSGSGGLSGFEAQRLLRDTSRRLRARRLLRSWRDWAPQSWFPALPSTLLAVLGREAIAGPLDPANDSMFLPLVVLLVWVAALALLLLRPARTPAGIAVVENATHAWWRDAGSGHDIALTVAVRGRDGLVGRPEFGYRVAIEKLEAEAARSAV